MVLESGMEPPPRESTKHVKKVWVLFTAARLAFKLLIVGSYSYSTRLSLQFPSPTVVVRSFYVVDV